MRTRTWTDSVSIEIANTIRFLIQSIKHTSYYVGNTSYTAPIVSVRMKEYVPISYYCKFIFHIIILHQTVWYNIITK